MKAFNDGTPASELAQKYGVHFSSINAWARKLKAKTVQKRSPKKTNGIATPKDLDHLVQENEFLKMMCKNLMKLLELNTEKK